MIDRRLFLTGGWAAAALGGATGGEVKRRAGSRIKIGLNAYSFNRPLMAGTMTIPDVIDYCAQQEIDGVDLTGYYFKGYPNAPSDEVIYSIKRAAFLNGVTITGTGVRNDFALTAAFQECAEYGAKRGVIVGLQHHDDFLKTAEQTIRVVDLVKSEWFSVILDVGSLRQGDPYAEIEKLLPYASNWQVKEHVWYGTKKVEIDLPRIRKIIDKVGYRGFTPIEALGEGDPKAIVTAFLGKVRQAFA